MMKILPLFMFYLPKNFCRSQNVPLPPLYYVKVVVFSLFFFLLGRSGREQKEKGQYKRRRSIASASLYYKSSFDQIFFKVEGEEASLLNQRLLLILDAWIFGLDTSAPLRNILMRTHSMLKR